MKTSEENSCSDVKNEEQGLVCRFVRFLVRFNPYQRNTTKKKSKERNCMNGFAVIVTIFFLSHVAVLLMSDQSLLKKSQSLLLHRRDTRFDFFYLIERTMIEVTEAFSVSHH